MHDLHLSRWTPELRRAVMAVRPEFFGWPAEQQTRYRVALPRKDRSALAKLLLEEVAGRRAAAALARQEDKGTLPLDLQNRVNELLLPLVGLGTDAFYLNEILGKGLSILDFPTLRAYDERDHDFQEGARAEEDAQYVKQPYLGALYGRWARVLVDGRLTYLTLSMASGHLYDRISEAAAEELQRRIPHRHVRGIDDGKREGGMIRWDIRVDAGGEEAMLEELQHRVLDYGLERWQALKAERDALGLEGVHVLDTSELGESSLQVVFTDKHALGKVRFDTFMADCLAIERPVEELQAAAAVETERVHEFIAQQHEDLRLHFDPKITRLRRRYKIMMHPRALDDLASLDDE